jgi:hypothetical protein
MTHIDTAERNRAQVWNAIVHLDENTTFDINAKNIRHHLSKKGIKRSVPFLHNCFKHFVDFGKIELLEEPGFAGTKNYRRVV